MKKNMMMSTFVVAALTIACYGGVKVYKAFTPDSPNNLLLANVEALSNPEGGDSGEYPRYINKTDKNSYKEFKTEVTVDTAGVKVSIDYSRTCTSYYTFCKHTRKAQDICYGNLNGMATDCGDWTKAN